jgi:hypothetical protein
MTYEGGAVREIEGSLRLRKVLGKQKALPYQPKAGRGYEITLAPIPRKQE